MSACWLNGKLITSRQKPPVPRFLEKRLCLFPTAMSVKYQSPGLGRITDAWKPTRTKPWKLNACYLLSSANVELLLKMISKKFDGWLEILFPFKPLGQLGFWDSEATKN